MTAVLFEDVHSFPPQEEPSYTARCNELLKLFRTIVQQGKKFQADRNSALAQLEPVARERDNLRSHVNRLDKSLEAKQAAVVECNAELERMRLARKKDLEAWEKIRKRGKRQMEELRSDCEDKQRECRREEALKTAKMKENFEREKAELQGEFDALHKELRAAKYRDLLRKKDSIRERNSEGSGRGNGGRVVADKQAMSTVPVRSAPPSALELVPELVPVTIPVATSPEVQQPVVQTGLTSAQSVLAHAAERGRNTVVAELVRATSASPERAPPEVDGFPLKRRRSSSDPPNVKIPRLEEGHNVTPVKGRALRVIRQLELLDRVASPAHPAAAAVPTFPFDPKAARAAFEQRAPRVPPPRSVLPRVQLTGEQAQRRDEVEDRVRSRFPSGGTWINVLEELLPLVADDDGYFTMNHIRPYVPFLVDLTGSRSRDPTHNAFKSLQRMRDRGRVTFYGLGEYKLL